MLFRSVLKEINSITTQAPYPSWPQTMLVLPPRVCFGVVASQVMYSNPANSARKLTSRTTGGIDPLMHQYNASIGYDKFLYKEDILGSIAFARANAKSGIISNDEFNEIERGLKEVMKEWEAGTFTIMPNDEDVSPSLHLVVFLKCLIGLDPHRE